MPGTESAHGGTGEQRADAVPVGDGGRWLSAASLVSAALCQRARDPIPGADMPHAARELSVVLTFGELQ
eukprot:786278-Rhodomonas_salina.2